MLVIKRNEYERMILKLPNGDRITIEQRPGWKWAIKLPDDVVAVRGELEWKEKRVA